MANYFKLIRWKNLLLIAYFYVLVKFLVFPSFQIDGNLNLVQFLFFLLSVLCLAAAGNIINDIFDVQADLINKPHKTVISTKISVEKAQNWYKFTNLFGIILGVIISFQLNKPTYSLIFIATAILLNLYSKKIKHNAFLKNITIAFLTGISVLLIAIFEFNTIKSQNEQNVFNLIIILSVFSFLINLIREIVKDIQDINGDFNAGFKTLPIILGRSRTAFLTSLITVVPISLTLYIILNLPNSYNYLKVYLLIGLLVPLLVVFSKLKKLPSTKELKNTSNLLKWILFLGINSLLLLTLFY